MCNVVLTAGGNVRVKELEVIAHAIAYCRRGFPYYRCQLPMSITCRVKWPLKKLEVIAHAIAIYDTIFCLKIGKADIFNEL